MQTGLVHRLRRVVRQMGDQHRRLRALTRGLHEALAPPPDPREALSCFDPYRDALEAHFRLEGEIFFPALHGLHPEWEPRLVALEEEHETLRQELAALRADLEADAAREAGSRLEAFLSRLADHEAREERLVSRYGDGDGS